MTSISQVGIALTVGIKKYKITIRKEKINDQVQVLLL